MFLITVEDLRYLLDIFLVSEHFDYAIVISLYLKLKCIIKPLLNYLKTNFKQEYDYEDKIANLSTQQSFEPWRMFTIGLGL